MEYGRVSILKGKSEIADFKKEKGSRISDINNKLWKEQTTR